MAGWQDDPVVQTAPQPKTSAAPKSAPAQKSRRGQSANPLVELGGAFANANDWLFFGGADEINGGLYGLGALAQGKPFGPAFEEGRQRQKAIRQDFEERRPIAANNAKVFGAGLPILLSGGAAAPEMSAMNMARISQTATPLADAARVGAGAGAVGGFLGSEGTPNERLPGAGLGAAGGAVVGPLATKALGLAGEAGAAIGKYFSQASPEMLGQMNSIGAGMPGMMPPGPPPAQKAAAKQMVRAMVADEVTPQIMQQRAKDAQAAGAGQDTYAAELGGPNMQELTRSVMSVPGKTKAVGTQKLEQRAEGAAGRIRDAAAAQLNPGGKNLYAELDDITRTQKANADKLFAAADKTPVTPDDMKVLGPLLGTNAGQRAVAQAAIIASNRRIPFNPEQPDFLTLRTIREGLDTAINQAGRINPMNGKVEYDRMGASMIDVRTQLDRALKKMSRERTNDALGRADMAWAGPEKQKAAMDAGRKVFTTDAELSDAKIARMSADERRAYQIGVARAVVDRVAGTNDSATANYAGKIAGKQILRERLRPAFLTEQSFNAFMVPVQREIDRMQFARNTLPGAGSKTQPSMTGLMDLFADMAEGAGPKAKAREAFAALARARGAGPSNPAVNDAFSSMLFSPADELSSLDPVFAEYLRQHRRQAAEQMLAPAGGQTAGRAMGQAGR